MTYLGVLPFLRRSMVTIRENVPLAPYTYFKIGGPAHFFVEARTEEELEWALDFAKQHGAPFWILGSGSNVLIADKGLPGLVIRTMMNGISVDGEKLVCGAGVAMARAVAKSVDQGLTGFEWAIGIPGTVGGSVRGNAGCFGSEIKDVTQNVRVLQFPISSPSPELRLAGNFQFPIKEFNNNDCHFDYRESIFKRDPLLIILSATLQLKKGNPDKSRGLIARYAMERTGKQDIGEQCAGCMFKNISPDKPAGKLIEDAGCKGMRVGNAMVSEKHANYFVNCGGASAKDVLALAEQVKERVREVYGIALEEEIQVYS